MPKIQYLTTSAGPEPSQNFQAGQTAIVTDERAQELIDSRCASLVGVATIRKTAKAKTANRESR